MSMIVRVFGLRLFHKHVMRAFGLGLFHEHDGTSIWSETLS